MKPLALVLAALLPAACSDQRPAADAPDVAPAARDTAAEPPAGAADAAASPGADAQAPVEADYLGRWTGVEGMYLVVAAKPDGGVGLDMQWDLDNRGSFDGSVTAEGLRFMRNGVAETAVRTDGDATGLKHLAGKRDCLTVKPGEGYCRD
jgi:hypothetical protein